MIKYSEYIPYCFLAIFLLSLAMANNIQRIIKKKRNENVSFFRAFSVPAFYLTLTLIFGLSINVKDDRMFPFLLYLVFFSAGITFLIVLFVSLFSDDDSYLSDLIGSTYVIRNLKTIWGWIRIKIRDLIRPQGSERFG